MALISSLNTVPKICVYGGPGSGKTKLVGELSSHYNLLWFDIDNGWSTLKTLSQDQQSRINLIHLPDSKTYPIAVETWAKIIKGGPTSICSTHGKVSCVICTKASAPFESVDLSNLPANTVVVFDSLTQFGVSAIAHITKHQPDDYKLLLDDWGNLKFIVEKFLSQVQAANYPIICITHEEEVTMEDGRTKLVPVCGSSKSSRNTGRYFSDIVYCSVKNKKHTFMSGSTAANGILTSSRAGIAIEDLAVPSLLPFFLSPPSYGTVSTTIDTSLITKETVNTTNSTANNQAERLRNLMNKSR